MPDWVVFSLTDLSAVKAGASCPPESLAVNLSHRKSPELGDYAAYEVIRIRWNPLNSELCGQFRAFAAGVFAPFAAHRTPDPHLSFTTSRAPVEHVMLVHPIAAQQPRNKANDERKNYEAKFHENTHNQCVKPSARSRERQIPAGHSHRLTLGRYLLKVQPIQ